MFVGGCFGGDAGRIRFGVEGSDGSEDDGEGEVVVVVQTARSRLNRCAAVGVVIVHGSAFTGQGVLGGAGPAAARTTTRGRLNAIVTASFSSLPSSRGRRLRTVGDENSMTLSCDVGRGWMLLGADARDPARDCASKA